MIKCVWLQQNVNPKWQEWYLHHVSWFFVWSVHRFPCIAGPYWNICGDDIVVAYALLKARGAYKWSWLSIDRILSSSLIDTKDHASSNTPLASLEGIAQYVLKINIGGHPVNQLLHQYFTRVVGDHPTTSTLQAVVFQSIGWLELLYSPHRCRVVARSNFLCYFASVTPLLVTLVHRCWRKLVCPYICAFGLRSGRINLQCSLIWQLMCIFDKLFIPMDSVDSYVS